MARLQTLPAMLRDAPVALLLVDSHAQVLDANPAFVDTVGPAIERTPSGRTVAEVLGCDAASLEAALHRLQQETLAEVAIPDPCGGFPVRLIRWPTPEALCPALVLQPVLEAADRLEPLKRALDQITDGLLVVGADWRILFANRAAADFVGTPRIALVGVNLWERFDYLLGSELERRIRSVALHREPAELEFRTPLRKRWVELKAFPSADGITLSFSDRTAERETLAALRSSESRFRAMFEYSLEGVILSEAAGEVLSANPAACALFGRTEAELKALGRGGLVAKEEGRLAELLAERERTGRARRELQLVRRDGSRFTAEVASSTFQGADGDRLTVIMFHDLTERKRAQAGLEFLVRAGKELGRSLDYEKTLDALTRLVVPEFADLCMVDLVEGSHTRRVAVSHRVPSEGEKLRDRSFALDHGNPWVGIARVIRTQQAELVEEVSEAWIAEAIQNPLHRAAVYDVHPVSVMHVPLVERGQTLGALTLALVKDNPRRFTARDLPLAQGLADLAAQALDHARLFAEAVGARQVRDDLLAVVSHDLRNPLQTVVLCTELLARVHPDPTVDLLRASAARTQRLIEDLLVAGSLEQGGAIALERSPTSLAEVVEEALALHRAKAADRTVSLQAQLAPDLPLLPLDRHRMLQLLENLVGNALRFTPRKGRITVGARPQGDHVTLWVEDTGSGISPEDLPHVFDRFWRGRDQHHAGVGLGLAIAKGIAELHGGSIRVENAPGAGARFVVELPGNALSSSPHVS